MRVRLLKTARSTTQWRRALSSIAPVSMTYNRYGDATKSASSTPLVICHGLFGQKQNWNSVAKQLARRLSAPVYAVDLRNHGESPWNPLHSYEAMAVDLNLFLSDVVQRETGAVRAHVLGHSMGGKVAAYFALQPEFNKRLEKLIIEDIAPHRPASASLFLRYVEALQMVDLTKSRADILVQLEGVVPELAVRQFLLTNLQRTEEGFRWKMNLEAIGKALNHVLMFNVRNGRHDGPTMVVHGGKSDYFLDEDKPTFSKFFPNAVFESIPDAGHWLHAEQPEQFIDCVTKFL